jgi:hypothetical protein
MPAMQGASSSGTAPAPASAADASGPAATANPAGAKAALLASVKHMTMIYRYTGGQNGLTTRGHVDPARKAASMAASGTMNGVTFTQNVIAIGTNYWIQLNLGATANAQLGVKVGTWMHIDAAKLGATGNLPFDLTGTDALGLAAMLRGIGQARQTDQADYAGVIDLTAANGVTAYSQDNLDKLGAKAKAMPFTATLDPLGRLTDFVIDASPVNQTLGARYTFADFGVAYPINRPVNNVIEAPADVYALFKN